MAQKKKSRKQAAKPPAVRPKVAARATVKKKPVRTAAARKPAARKPAARKPAAKKSAARRAALPLGADPNDPVAQIQRVIEVMVAAGAVEVELEEAGTKIRVRLKADMPVPVAPYATAGAPGAVGPVVAAAQAPDAAVGAAAVAYDDPKRTVFKSPMVGTFYRAATPDADPYVEVGDRVGPDTTICILEAMKVMNEIKAETSGEIVEVLAQNGEPVEFGQPLFVIRVD